jgi:hypothetical protein
VQGKKLSDWNWALLELHVQESALRNVTEQLLKQGIADVAVELIELRLQSAITDLKASMDANQFSRAGLVLKFVGRGISRTGRYCLPQVPPHVCSHALPH